MAMDTKDIKLMVQSTPNPNALKFVLNVPVKTEGKATYKKPIECVDNRLAGTLFALEHVAEVYFFDNYITVTQNGDADWDELEEKVKKIILENMADHNPNFEVPQPVKMQLPQNDNPEIAKIDAILDQTIRPALQMDGGDIQLMELNGNVLKVNYQGACGSCPSSSMGTLKAIESLLRNEYNPDLVVEMAA